MPFPLPTEVLQGLGLAPPPIPAMPDAVPPIDSSLMGAPPVDIASLAPPSVVPPLPAAPPTPEPVLPSLAAPPQSAPPQEPSRDYQVPVSAFGHGGQAPAAPHPHAPQMLSPDAQMNRAQLKQSQADVDSANAIAAKRDADVNLARDELAANRAYDVQAAEIERQRKAQVEDSVKIHAQKQAYVDATMRDVDSYKVDQNKFVNQMGLGGMAGWGIAMIMSGIGDTLQHKQGPNAVVQMLQQKMHDSVVAQMDERDQLKERNQRAQHGLDKYDQWSKDRQAQISLLDAQNEKRLANMLREAAAKAREPLAQANALAEASKLEESSAEKAQKASEFASTNEIAKKQLQVSQGQLGVAQFSAKESARHNAATEELTEQQRLLEAQKLEKAGKDNEAKLVRERAIGGEVVPVKDASGKVIGTELRDITTRDGKTWIPRGTEASLTALQKSHPAAEQFVQTLDQILKLGPEYLSDTANSDKKQKLDELMGDLRLQTLAAKNLGVPTGHDIELAEKFIGTTDPTRFRDSLAGLKQARDSVIRDHNIELKTHGLDKKWEPFNEGNQLTAQQSATEQLQTSLKTKPDENRERVWQTTYAQTRKANGGDTEAAKRAADQAMTEAGAIAPKQRADLEALKAQAIGGDADALAAIQDVAKSGGSATIRRMATEALSEIRTAARPTPTTSSAGPTYDPNGYDPASLINRFHAPVQPTIDPRTRSASVP